MVEKEPQVEQFEDAESYVGSFGKDKLSFKFIVLQHLQRIGQYASVEMHGGYFQERTKVIQGSAVTEQIYISDTREIYSHAVDYFADVLAPHFDKEMKKQEEENNKELDECSKKYFESEKNKTKEAEWKKQSYRGDKVEIKSKLFRALCCFLYRQKYLEMGKIED